MILLDNGVAHRTIHKFFLINGVLGSEKELCGETLYI